jgi:hypothetical protein
VFPARYELNSYIVFRKRLVSKRLNTRIMSSDLIRVTDALMRYFCGFVLVCG